MLKFALGQELQLCEVQLHPRFFFFFLKSLYNIYEAETINKAVIIISKAIIITSFK